MDYDDIAHAELGLEPEDVYDDNEDDDVLRRYSRKVDDDEDEDEDEPEEEVEEEEDDNDDEDDEESESEGEEGKEEDKDKSKTKNKTKTKPKRKAKEVEDTPEEVPTLSLAPTTQQKIIFMIVGAIAAGLGILISYLFTRNRNRDPNTDRFLYFCMMLLHKMNTEKGYSHQHCPIHEFEDKENADKDKIYSASSSRIQSTREYLEHVAKHGAQRIESRDLKPEERTFKLPEMRKHEHWKVEKDLKDEVTDCYKTHEYLK